MGRAMDESVARSMAKWPNVPDVYGWLMLDRRGNWLVRSKGDAQRFERIGNAAFRDFISRNYLSDARGRWYFQNGPQRVFVKLAYTPLVVHHEGEALVDHCGRPFQASEAFLDDEGSVLFAGAPAAALLDDRDLERYSERPETLSPIKMAEVAGRFRFVPEPRAAGSTTRSSKVIKASPETLYRALSDPAALAWLGKVRARVIEQVPGKKIVRSIVFDTSNELLEGEMVLTVTFEPEQEGTKVFAFFEDIPPGIKLTDHEAGVRAYLEALARQVER
jgi:uncharacterized protein YndB with AHSA1/START domain